MPAKKSIPKVRVRFPPSPTGFLHIGSLRTALYNYLFARKHGGTFILRIEDTDRARYVEGGVENIIRTLKWCGIEYDEGPYLPSPPPQSSPIKGEEEKGTSPPSVGGARGGGQIMEHGDCGPYVQSQRLDIYRKYASELLKNGSAYLCTCTSERLAKLREEQTAEKMPTKYDGICRNSKPEILNSKLFVVRLKVPEQGSTKFSDMIRGEVEFENALIDDQVLMKSDGYPTYHLANVVDDHMMKITHVIRGEEWLSSTPKHVLLYNALKWKPPQFAHLPLLLNSDHSKLSKRQGDVAVEDYIKKGYLPEALLNFVALLGFNPRADKELYTLDELIAEFDLTKVNKSGAVVNFEKLDWMNGHYIRQMSLDALVELAMPYLPGVRMDVAQKIIALERERIKKLGDLLEVTAYLSEAQPEYPATILVWKKMLKKDVAKNLEGLREFFTQYNNAWDAATIEREIKAWITQKGTPVGETLWPMRVALSGREASPPPFEIAAILGKAKTLKRIEYAIKMATKL